jgi:hypothetical protein
MPPGGAPWGFTPATSFFSQWWSEASGWEPKKHSRKIHASFGYLFIYFHYIILLLPRIWLKFLMEMSSKFQLRTTSQNWEKKRKKEKKKIWYWDSTLWFLSWLLCRERMNVQRSSRLRFLVPCTHTDQHVMVRRVICLALAASLEAQFRSGGLKHKDTTN